MNLAFTITEDDIINVLNNHNIKFNQTKLEEILEIIDDNQVSESALNIDMDVNDDDISILDKQTEEAYNEIARQLYKSGYLSKDDIKDYGNPMILYQ